MARSNLHRLGSTAAVVVSAVVVVWASDQPTRWQPWVAVLGLSAGLGLVTAAGLLAAVPRLLLTLVASGSAVAISGFSTVGRAVRFEAASTIAVALVGPLLLLLVVKAPPGAGRGIRSTAAVVAIGALAVIRALVYDPFADVACRGLCHHSPIVITTNLGLAHVLGLLAAAATVIVALSAARTAIRAREATRRDGTLLRAAELAIAAAALLLGADAALGLAFSRVATPGESSVGVLVVMFLAALLVSVALVLIALDPLRARRDVGRVARLLAAGAGAADPQTILRMGFGDPDLLVGYWAEGIGYVDGNGAVLRLPPPDSRIELTAHHAPLAVIIPASGAVPSELITRQIGSQARLAIHNESLELELKRNIADVERSRRRIVEAGDTERRDLERDLHDGAQQRLLALSFELRRGERAAMAAGDGRTAAAFASATTLAQAALEQLRRLAHGIHPAILDGAGLQDALMALAVSEGRTVTLDVDVDGPLPGWIESATYGVLAATIANQSAAAAPAITVRRDGDGISMTIDRVASLSEHAIDRAEAAGGHWTQTDSGFEVALPCAW